MDMQIEVNGPTLIRYADGITDFYNPASYPTTLSITNVDNIPSYIKSVDANFRAWCDRHNIGMTNFRDGGSLCSVSGLTGYAENLLNRQFAGPGLHR